jgi:hypothetical protein
MKKNQKKQKNPNDLVVVINKVKEYILMEYGEEDHKKISSSKYINVLTGYVKNCMSLKVNNSPKYTVPEMANNLVRFVRSQV